MKKKYFQLLFLSFFVIASPMLQSCGNSKSGRNSKKIQRGKPIPCPIKDC